jgi:uncharacterized GH25 family protein
VQRRTNNKRRRTAAFVLLAWLSAIPMFGHDFWIEPSTFRPAVGQMITASLLVGQDFAGDPVPRSVQLMDSFTVRETGGERPIVGMENRDPAGYLRLEKSGIAVIGYRSKPYPLELAADKFEDFLKLEGLENIRALRLQRGESKKPDRERFFRYAKSIVLTGQATASDGAAFDQVFGYRLELIPETNPMTATPLCVRILFEGKPLAGALVTAIPRDNPLLRISARSDRAGHVTLNLPGPGVWLVKSVQIVPAPAGANVDWESLWASLTFQR